MKTINQNIDERERILEKLFSLHRFGIKPGLERTLKLLESCGNPHLQFPSVHIAGTNGKGSVSSIISSILIESGCKTGLYTSPHLVKFNERIKINGEDIEDDIFIELTNRLLPLAMEMKATFFEITTVLAFLYFAEKKVDIAVIETGMGGRFDSTNVLEPLISIITNIDYDHQEYLGDTLEEIAFEKAGIMKYHTPCVLGNINHSVKSIFLDKASELNITTYWAQEYCKGRIILTKKELHQIINLKTPNNEYENLEMPLAGKHQLDNLMIALTAAELLSYKFKINTNSIKNGILKLKENSGLKARIELIREEPPLIIDVAHNPDSTKIMIETLELCGWGTTKFNILFGVMEDKDIMQMLKSVKPMCNRLIATQPKIERARKAPEISKIAGRLEFIDIVTEPDSTKALEKLLFYNEPALIFGSFYLIGEILPLLDFKLI
ncbi:MAG: Bifunctional folylpolyglutamate synthase/dihydrofolate synthase [Ignavibacteria bacterium]|nr:Bifunctional folylpolyglutamate synthase/dihydrofolate synthase [Ignavibacteria bacterium]